MKNIGKKILLVILSLIILTVSAYAWAYVSGNIDIDGIKVQPSGSSGLFISKSGTKTFSATVNASTTSSKSLSGVSTSDLKNWYIPENSNSISSSGSYDSTYELIESSNASDYYYSESFDIKTTEGLAGLKISNITITTSDGGAPTKKISKSLRIGILTNSSTNAYIYAPVSGYDENCVYVNGTSSTTSISFATVGTTQILSPVAAGDTYTITVFVWYEGQDKNYTTENLNDSEALVINIEFSGVSY